MMNSLWPLKINHHHLIWQEQQKKEKASSQLDVTHIEFRFPQFANQNRLPSFEDYAFLNALFFRAKQLKCDHNNARHKIAFMIFFSFHELTHARKMLISDAFDKPYKNNPYIYASRSMPFFRRQRSQLLPNPYYLADFIETVLEASGDERFLLEKSEFESLAAILLKS